MPNTEHLCEEIALLLKELGVGVVITGGIGDKAKTALEAEGILVISGVTGDVREAAEAYLKGKFEPSGAVS